VDQKGKKRPGRGVIFLLRKVAACRTTTEKKGIIPFVEGAP